MPEPLRRKAALLRASAANWRTLASALVALGGIGAAVYGNAAARISGIFGAEEFDAGTFVVVTGVIWLSALVILWPYFMISKVMVGIADLMDEISGESAVSDMPDALSGESDMAVSEDTQSIAPLPPPVEARIPPEGLPTRVQPHPGEIPSERLEGGSTVSVLERRGGWALVRTHSGETVWVDGRRLV